MSNLKVLFAALAFAGLSSAAQAQEFEPYSFVGLQGGVQVTNTDYTLTDVLTPNAGVQVGRYFAPEFGGRISAQGIWGRGAIKSVPKIYEYSQITSDVDLLFNLTNIIGTKKYHRVNAILVAGLGLTYAWDNQQALDVRGYKEKNFDPWSDHLFTHNFRAGMICDVNIGKNWSVNLEADANNHGDRFNSKFNNHCDWQLTAMMGVNFKFGKKRSTGSSNTAPAQVEVADIDIPQELAPEEKHIVLFFGKADVEISEADDRRLRRLSGWCKRYHGLVTVSGYADKGTGSADINMKYSKERAEQVAKRLSDEYGIPSKYITVNAYGDTQQPFAENDKNRCVIIDAVEQKK